MTHRERMTPIDTAWLRMDRPSNLMVIVGIMVLATPVSLDRLRKTLEIRLAGRFHRFRQRVAEGLGGPYWEGDPEFNLDHHVIPTKLPRGKPEAQLQKLTSHLASEPLNPNHPLWRFHLVEHYQGGSAIVVRIHHCIADGIALVGVMMSLTDLSADTPEPESPPRRRKAVGADHPRAAFTDPMMPVSGAAIKVASTLWAKYLELAGDPQRLADFGRDGVGYATELAKLLTLPADSPTRFKGSTGLSKRVAWSGTIPVDDIKALGKPLGCSVNDVLLSAVAGALRRYLLNKGDSVDGVEVRAMVPVNLRGSNDEHTLGNRFGLVTLSLPIWEGNPFARLFEIRRRMRELRGSYLAPLSLAIFGALGLAPKPIYREALALLSAKASAVMTNVPGPKEPLYLAGAKLSQMMFWVPQAGDIGMGVSILSYANEVQFSLITDARLVPDPEAITPLFQSEFDNMLYGLMMGEWSERFDATELEMTIEKQIARDAAATVRRSPTRVARTRKAPHRSASAVRGKKPKVTGKTGAAE